MNKKRIITKKDINSLYYAKTNTNKTRDRKNIVDIKVINNN